MTNTNVKVVEGYIDQVMNQKRLERLSEFCSEDCVVHASPYVGLGVNFDDSSGEKLILTHIAPRSPAAGHLHEGDELVRVRSDEQTWESFDAFRNGIWARGEVGAEVAITVRRHGNLVTIPLRFAQIDHFDIKLSEFYNIVIPHLKRFWPDHKMEIREIFGSDDRVACFLVNQGTNIEYHRSAIWAEMDMFKLKDGRITDIWYVENTFDEMKQLGYQVTEPVREIA